jgi:hypothetical protein
VRTTVRVDRRFAAEVREQRDEDERVGQHEDTARIEEHRVETR